MYYRNYEQDPNNLISEDINGEDIQQDRRKHTDKHYMEMPHGMQPMGHCPYMETCQMKESCPIMMESTMMPEMDPDDPDPRFGRRRFRRFHHFHHHFHHHFFHPFFPFFR